MRKSRVFAAGLGDQNMVVEDVSVEVETTRGKWPKTSEVLVFSVRPKAAQTSRCCDCRKYGSSDLVGVWCDRTRACR